MDGEVPPLRQAEAHRVGDPAESELDGGPVLDALEDVSGDRVLRLGDRGLDVVGQLVVGLADDVHRADVDAVGVAVPVDSGLVAVHLHDPQAGRPLAVRVGVDPQRTVVEVPVLVRLRDVHHEDVRGEPGDRHVDEGEVHGVQVHGAGTDMAPVEGRGEHGVVVDVADAGGVAHEPVGVQGERGEDVDVLEFLRMGGHRFHERAG